MNLLSDEAIRMLVRNGIIDRVPVLTPAAVALLALWLKK